ncbi:sulfate adenylyltransferase large subunit [Bradyrhizobium sp. USDA 4508]
MNMILPTASISATPNGTTRPQVRIVIVGHVDHGKSTLVGRLLHETGSLPDGKLEMLKAVSARRGMPFEWSFLLDALQTERDQGITIDTTQIRFRTRSRDVVLIDAPGHAEFLRNMITGASQADGAVLIIDALEGVRDQTRRHGYLLHLLGVKQVAVVVNKMDRVEFSADRFKEISDEISAHLIGLGVTPTAVIPISARDGDGVAERTPRIDWYKGATVVEALDALEPARPLAELPLRLPVQAIYKFDDRRIVAGRIESGSLKAGDEIVIMPTGKIARIKTVESWPVTPVNAPQGAGRSVGITLDRELFLERGDIIGHSGQSPRDTRRIRARIFWLHDKPLTKGEQILIRLGTKESRATVVAIEKAVDPGALSNEENTAIARNHVGEIDISLAQPVATDPYTDNPRTGRLVIEVNGRIAGGGLVLSVDAGRPAVAGRYRAGGVRAAAGRALGALPPQRRSGLADRPARLGQVDPGAGAGTAPVRQWRLADPARWRHAACRAERRSRLLAAGPRRKHPPPRRSRDPSGAQRPYRHRRRGVAIDRRPCGSSPHRRQRIPRDLCRNACRGLRDPRSEGPLRQGALRRIAVFHRHHQ